MARATVASKGQITIPKRVRTDLGLTAGDVVDFVTDGRGGYSVKPMRQASSLQGICNAMVRGRRHVSVAKMGEIVAAVAAERSSSVRSSWSKRCGFSAVRIR